MLSLIVQVSANCTFVGKENIVRICSKDGVTKIDLSTNIAVSKALKNLTRSKTRMATHK